MLDALADAQRRRLIDPDMPPRATAAEATDHMVRVIFDGDERTGPGVTFVVDDGSGRHEGVSWEADVSLEEVGVLLAQATEQLGGNRGDFSVTRIFRELSVMLTAAMTSPDRRPVIAVSEPQWLITPTRLVLYGHAKTFPYAVSRSSLSDTNFIRHVRQKPWCDVDSFDRALDMADIIYRSDHNESII